MEIICRINASKLALGTKDNKNHEAGSIGQSMGEQLISEWKLVGILCQNRFVGKLGGLVKEGWLFLSTYIGSVEDLGYAEAKFGWVLFGMPSKVIFWLRK